jgi:hypothetical protein
MNESAERYSDTTPPAAPQALGQPPSLPGQAPVPPQVPATAQDIRVKSPAVACCLSAMPGLGQVYVGYYQRGFLHAIIVAGLISALATHDQGSLTPLFGLFLAFFWLYNMIDAARRASLYNQALAGGHEPDLPTDFESPGLRGSMVGGAVLIVVGTLLLANTRFDVSLEWLEEWWPAAIILFGAYLFFKAYQERSATNDTGGTGE